MKRQLANNWRRLIITAGIGSLLASMIAIALSGAMPGIGHFVFAGIGIFGAIITCILVIFREGSFSKRILQAIFSVSLLILGFAVIGLIFGFIWKLIYQVTLQNSWIMALYLAILAPYAGIGIIGGAKITERSDKLTIDDIKLTETILLTIIISVTIASLTLLLISGQQPTYILVGLISGILIYIVIASILGLVRKVIRRLHYKAPVPAYPLTRDFREYKVAIPLKVDFRFAHGPIRSADAKRFVGRTAELDALVERILFSEGGSFLVTGYRGVGKTSFVNQVVGRLNSAMPWAQTVLGPTRVLDVQMNIARSLTPAELMHHIITVIANLQLPESTRVRSRRRLS